MRHGAKIVLHMDAPEEGRQIWRESEKKEMTVESVYSFVLMVRDIQLMERRPNRSKQMLS